MCLPAGRIIHPAFVKIGNLHHINLVSPALGTAASVAMLSTFRGQT
jgi:hypothetical protein